MAQAVNAAPISIRIERDGHRPSIRVRGVADGSNISRIVSLLERLADKDERCVSLDLLEVESIDHAALQGLVDSVGSFKSRKRRMHLHQASDAVWDMLNRLGLTEIFCNHSECRKPSNPDGCGHAWEMDVFSFSSLLVRIREARERVDRVAQAVGFRECDRSDVVLAVGEAVTNAIKYGANDDDSVFTVSCIATAERLCVSVSDSGPGFDPRNLPSFEEALFMEHGRGIHCMKSVMDEVSFDFNSGTTVRMVKHSR